METVQPAVGAETSDAAEATGVTQSPSKMANNGVGTEIISAKGMEKGENYLLKSDGQGHLNSTPTEKEMGSRVGGKKELGIQKEYVVSGAEKEDLGSQKAAEMKGTQIMGSQKDDGQASTEGRTAVAEKSKDKGDKSLESGDLQGDASVEDGKKEASTKPEKDVVADSSDARASGEETDVLKRSPGKTKLPETDADKIELPKSTTQKTESPKLTLEKTESPKSTTQKTESPKSTAEKTESPKLTAERTETPKSTPEKTELPKLTPEKTESAKSTAETTELPKLTPEKTKSPKSTPEKTESPKSTPENTESLQSTPEKTESLKADAKKTNSSGLATEPEPMEVDEDEGKKEETDAKAEGGLSTPKRSFVRRPATPGRALTSAWKRKRGESEEEDGEEKEEKKVEGKRGRRRARKEPEEAVEDEEEGEEEGEEEKKPVPLLDEPLRREGRRTRKQVQRYGEDYMADFRNTSGIDVPQGTGVALSEIEYTENQIQRARPEDLMPMYRILFGRNGKRNDVKKNMLSFRGFEFEEGSAEYDKKLNVIKGCHVNSLKMICDVLGLEKSGSKDMLSERILQFLLKPQDLGKVAPVIAKPRATRLSKDSPSGSGSGSSSGRKRPSPRGVPKRVYELENSDDDFESDGEKDEDEEWRVSEDSSGDDWRQNRRKKKKGTPRPRRRSTRSFSGRKGKGKGRGKRSAPPKDEEDEEEPDEDEPEEEEDEEEEIEDTPPAKKSKRMYKVDLSEDDSDDDKDEEPKKTPPPSNADIRASIKKILKGANLEEITMKTVCKQVYAQFPDHDLSDRKDFIKETVKSVSGGEASRLA